MKKTLFAIMLLLCALLALGVIADMGLPAYEVRDVVVSNPDGAKLYAYSGSLIPVDEVVPYGVKLTVTFGGDEDTYYFDEENQRFYYAVTFRGYERYISEIDFVTVENWDAPFMPTEDTYTPAGTDSGSDLTAAYSGKNAKSAANISVMSIIVYAIDALLAAAIVVLIILLIKRKKK